MNNQELIYLATPYSHHNSDVKELRFHTVNKVAAQLMKENINVFSPISHTHPIALAGDLPQEWDFWQRFDRKLLSVCTKVIVLMLTGWDKSEGVKGEIEIAEEMGIPVEYISPDKFGITNLLDL